MNRRFSQDLHTAYEQKGKAAVISPGAGQQLKIFSIHLHNRSGGTCDIGLLVKLAAASFKFGLVSVLSTPDLTDATAAIQANTAQSLFTTTVNDGFLVQSEKRFNLIGLAVSQASTGAPIYAYEYWNGSAWSPLPDVLDTPVFSSIGDKLLVFSSPRDWSLGSDAAVGVDADKYAIRARASTAPTQDVIADDIWVGRFMHFQAQVAQNGNLGLSYGKEHPRTLDANEGILPYFSVASPSNLITAEYFSE